MKFHKGKRQNPKFQALKNRISSIKYLKNKKANEPSITGKRSIVKTFREKHRDTKRDGEGGKVLKTIVKKHQYFGKNFKSVHPRNPIG